MRKLMSTQKVMLSLMITLLLGYPLPSGSADRIFPASEIMADKVERISDDQLDKMRGGYIGGVYFSLNFTGYFDNNTGEDIVLSNRDTTKDSGQQVSYNDDPGSSTASNVALSGDANSGVISAVFGGLHESQGIFLVSQVPGSWNVINNHMNIELTVINVLNDLQSKEFHDIITASILAK